MFQSEPSVGSRRGRSSEERATRRAADFTLNSYSDLFKRSIDPLQQQQQQQVGSMCLTPMKVNAGVSFFTAWWLNRKFIYSCLMRRCWGSSLCLFVDSLCFQLVVTRCRCACITWAEPRSLMWCARRRCSLMTTLLLLLLGHIAGRPRGRGLHSICSFCNVCVVSSLCNHCHVTASRAGTLQLKDHPSSARCVFYTTARDFQTSNTS